MRFPLPLLLLLFGSVDTTEWLGSLEALVPVSPDGSSRSVTAVGRAGDPMPPSRPDVLTRDESPSCRSPCGRK